MATDLFGQSKKTVGVSTLLKDGASFLNSAGLENATREAELILAELIGSQPSALYLHPEWPVKADKQRAYSALLGSRAARKPLQYLLGSEGFRYLELEVHPGVFIPRPETELLVDVALEWLRTRSDEALGPVVDIGTGSGAVALSLALELPPLDVMATDISPVALETARRNAVDNMLEAQVSFFGGDGVNALPDELRSSVTLVVSNPPYLSAKDWQAAQPEVRWEPRVALEGGEDGLDFYRRLARETPDFLKRDGGLIVEVGVGQAAMVHEILVGDGPFDGYSVFTDLSGVDRVILATL